jgi:hypothetical protein
MAMDGRYAGNAGAVAAAMDKCRQRSRAVANHAMQGRQATETQEQFERIPRAQAAPTGCKPRRAFLAGL